MTQGRIAVGSVARIVLVALAVGALASGCGKRQTRPAAKAPAHFTARAIRLAFASAGIALHDPAPNGSRPHLFATVTMLVSVEPDPDWRVAANV